MYSNILEKSQLQYNSTNFALDPAWIIDTKNVDIFCNCFNVCVVYKYNYYLQFSSCFTLIIIIIGAV